MRQLLRLVLSTKTSGERSSDPGYYAAFTLGPDENIVEAVGHGPVERLAALGRFDGRYVPSYARRRGCRPSKLSIAASR